MWISPSRFDSFGMTVIEAQLNNIPVLATNICAIKEDNMVKIGDVINDGDDTDEWVSKIKLICSDSIGSKLDKFIANPDIVVKKIKEMALNE